MREEGDIVMSTLPSHDAAWPTPTKTSEARLQMVRAGLLGGLIGGVIIWIHETVSHFFYAVPLALIVKQRLR
jgi:hypothetical protein